MPRNNFLLNGDEVLRVIYRLLTIVRADAQFCGPDEDSCNPLNGLRAAFMEDELVHGLISSAVYNRIHMEHMRDIIGGPEEKICGYMKTNWEEETVRDLTFRETCNKIIHAMHIVFEAAGDPKYYPVSDIFILRGNLNGQPWQARVDLEKYARATVLNFKRPQ